MVDTHQASSLAFAHDSSDKPLPTMQPPESLPQAAVSPLPPPSPSPSIPTQSTRDRGRTLFSSAQRSHSAGRLHPSDATIRQVSDVDVAGNERCQSDLVHSLSKSADSSVEVFTSKSSRTSDTAKVQQSPLLPEDPLKPDKTNHAVDKRTAAPKKLKQKPRPFAHFLGRTKSTRVDSGEPTPKSTNRNRFLETGEMPHRVDDPGLKTAPIQHEGDRSFRDMMTSTIRTHSADRQRPGGSEDGSIASIKETGRHHTATTPSGTSGVFFSNLKSSSTRAADGIGKASKGIFGKLARSGSSGERDVVTDENYVCSVINLPLVEQTRRTRISKRLESSRDKTEYWMPALPWRCIDYLNFKGCEEEGLYRIPGSGYKVKQWQRRFDTELDINLFDEPDLYDINIIGSMFKAWLRELPDELFPKETQARIAGECMGAKEVPQLLKDELSKLQPYNYYLLFAITCHLSLLHSYVDQNKMDYRNLCICFQPCLKMEAFCFQFLVCQWKHCWQGCWTEKEAIAEENRLLGGQPLPSVGVDVAGPRELVDERAVSSSDSSKPSSLSPAANNVEQAKPPPTKSIDVAKKELPHPDVAAQGSIEASTESHQAPPAQPLPQQLRPLSPLMPLSPLEM